MRRRKRPFWLLIICALSFLSLAYLIFMTEPFGKLFPRSGIPLSGTISTPIFFFIALFSFLLSLFSYLLNNIRGGIFISLFIVLYLILRLNHFTHPFFLIILLALFIVLELLFRRK